jgi:hypothetical protein
MGIMRTIKTRVEKLEDAIEREDAPLKIILAKPGQTEQEAIEAFYKRYPQVQGLVIILEKHH